MLTCGDKCRVEITVAFKSAGGGYCILCRRLDSNSQGKEESRQYIRGEIANSCLKEVILDRPLHEVAAHG